jgi:uncharacterized protein (TIGR02284 family)
MKDAHHDIRTLNTLIETTLDSADGYSEAAKKAANSSYKNLFEQWAAERRQIVSDLQSQVRKLGGTPDDDGSVLAAGHRMFLKLRETMGKDDAGVIDEVERGEDFIKARYEAALKDHELSASVRDAVAQAYSSVKAGHDQASRLKHTIHGR